MVFEIGEKEWHEQWHNDKNKPNGNKLKTYRLYKNNLVTCYYAENVRIRNEKSILSNFFNGFSTLEIEKGRYTKPVTPLSFRSCNLKCFTEWKKPVYTFWISVIHCDLTYMHSTKTVIIYILVYCIKKSIKLQAIGMWLVRKQLISYFLV